MTVHKPLLFFALSIMLAACSDSPDDPIPGSPDKGVPSDSALDSGPPAADTTVDTVPPGVPAKVCAAIVEAGGGARAGGDVQVCNDQICLVGRFDEQGKICVTVSDPNNYLFHALSHSANGKLYADAFVPIEVTQDDTTVGNTIDLGTVFAPTVEKTFTLDPDKGGKINFGDGSWLDIPSNVAELPLGESTAEVGLVSLDKANLHEKLLATYPGGADPVRAFMIVPFGVSFSSKIAYSLATDLPPSTKLKLLWTSEETGILEEKGPVEVDSNGAISGNGLDHLGLHLLVPE